MTIAEVNRAILSKVRIIKANDRKKAEFDYMLAQLIGINVGMCFSGKTELPPIAEIYPTLFKENFEKEEEEKARRVSELSALRFMEFAKAHNKKYTKGVGN